MKKFRATIRRTMGTMLRVLLMIYLAKEDKVPPPEKTGGAIRPDRGRPPLKVQPARN
jgi:hypothetical protein